MSNEELVELIRAGDREKVLELWAGVQRLVWWYACKWAGFGGTTPEDLMQEGFIAVLRAVESYDSAKGAKFTTALDIYLKAEFTEATGQRTQRQKLDPLQTATSLDAPLADADRDTLTLADALPDPAAADAIEDVAERDRLYRLRTAVAEALDTLPENQREAIVDTFWRGQKVTDRAVYNAAIKNLRHPDRSRALREYARE